MLVPEQQTAQPRQDRTQRGTPGTQGGREAARRQPMRRGEPSRSRRSRNTGRRGQIFILGVLKRPTQNPSAAALSPRCRPEGRSGHRPRVPRAPLHPTGDRRPPGRPPLDHQPAGADRGRTSVPEYSAELRTWPRRYRAIAVHGRRGQIFTFDILEDDTPVDEHAPELSPDRVPATQYHTQPRATASSVSCPQSPVPRALTNEGPRRESEGLPPRRQLRVS